ncbi:ufd-3, partial [Pristionchus pacificus]
VLRVEMDDVEMVEAVTQPVDYVLSRVLTGHKGEVKSVASTSQGMILSGGRDETLRMWIGRGGDYAEHNCLPQQPKGAIVYSIAYYENDDEWRIFVGRKDGAIAVYGSGSGNDPLITLKHHTSVVSCLHVDSVKGKLISGSWDNHIIIWPIEELTPGNEIIAALMCEGHSMSVWSVHSLNRKDEFHFLSASADQSIRLWHNDQCIKEFRGHSDVVRSLIVLDQSHFVSASNDGSLALWNIESTSPICMVKAPTDEFIYSMTKVGSDTLVTCGEGGHIIVWDVKESRGKGSITHTQVMHTPVASLWSVTTLKNKDVVIAGSDGRIFILTRDDSRIAPLDIRENLDAELSVRIAALLQQQQEKESETVTIKVAIDDGNANMELKYVKGTDPSLAAEKFIRDNNLPISYLNEITDYIKSNIPEAMNFTAKRRKIEHGGDVGGKMSFSILVEDGRQLTCSFDQNDDPDQIAQEFVEKNKLQIKYLASTSQMVRKEQAKSTSEFYDPFTGGGRYVPGGNEGIGGEGMGGDPLTGGGRYIPGSSKSGGITDGGDPLTSGGRYVPGATTDIIMPNASLPIDKKRPRGELCPLSKYFVFGAEQFNQKAYDRLVEDNEKSNEAVRLREDQLLMLKELAMNGPDGVKDEQMLVDTLNVGLEWNIDQLLPILDLFRIAILNEDVNRYYSEGDRSTMIRERLFALLVSDSNDNLKAIVCRAICNLFHHESGRKMISSEMKTFLPILGMHLLSSKPILQVAAASALSNWSYLLLQTSDNVCELGPREDGIREIVKALETHVSFGGQREDALTRVLQAISTLMWGDVTVIKLAKSRKIVDIVNRIKDAVVDERGKSLCRDIVEMTYAV